MATSMCFLESSTGLTDKPIIVHSLVIALALALAGVGHLVAGPAHDGGEDGSGGVVSSEAGLTETRTIITDQSGALLIVTHGGSDWVERVKWLEAAASCWLLTAGYMLFVTH